MSRSCSLWWSFSSTWSTYAATSRLFDQSRAATVAATTSRIGRFRRGRPGRDEVAAQRILAARLPQPLDRIDRIAAARRQHREGGGAEDVGVIDEELLALRPVGDRHLA